MSECLNERGPADDVALGEGSAHTKAPPVALMVAVYRGIEALFVLNEVGHVAAPAAAPDRASVALALAQASGALAIQPIQDSYRQNLCAAADRLTAIDTPASHDALEVLAAATRRQAEAFEAALALIEASVH